MAHRRSRILHFFADMKHHSGIQHKDVTISQWKFLRRWDCMVWLFMLQVLYCGKVNTAVLYCTLLPAGNVTFA